MYTYTRRRLRIARRPRPTRQRPTRTSCRERLRRDAAWLSAGPTLFCLIQCQGDSRFGAPRRRRAPLAREGAAPGRRPLGYSKQGTLMPFLTFPRSEPCSYLAWPAPRHLGVRRSPSGARHSACVPRCQAAKHHRSIQPRHKRAHREAAAPQTAYQEAPGHQAPSRGKVGRNGQLRSDGGCLHVVSSVACHRTAGYLRRPLASTYKRMALQVHVERFGR